MNPIAKLTTFVATVAALHGVAFARDQVASAVNAGTPLSTMTVDGPTGDAYRFDYFAGRGWVFVAHTPAQPPVQVATTALQSGMGTAINPVPGQQGRFVDGPTGYVFEWSAQGGWHFVGTSETQVGR